MADSPPAAPATTAASRAKHIGARIEDGIRAWRERRGRRRGLVPTVVPYVGYGGEGWIRVLGRVVLSKPGIARADRLTNLRGWRSFTSVAVSDVTVTVTAGAVTGVIRSDRGGVLDERVEADLPPGWNTVHLSIGDADQVEVPVFVVDEAIGFGIVSDIDDTVMVTSLPRPFLAAWNTFVLNEHARRAVTGMPVLYERLVEAHPGAPVIYLSTGAWNVVPALSRFLSRNMYPRGALLLTDWGPTQDRWFRSGAEHKRASLARLAAEFPGIRWLLIGDDGQKDETIYGEFAERLPDRVAAVAIRQLTVGEAVLAGGRSHAGDHPDETRWVYSPDGAGIAEQLQEFGLI